MAERAEQAGAVPLRVALADITEAVTRGGARVLATQGDMSSQACCGQAKPTRLTEAISRGMAENGRRTI